MKTTHYDRTSAARLIPLLCSIAREVAERTASLERLEAALEFASNDRQARFLVGEAATQRRELRHAEAEVARLGCSILGTQPVTFRIPVETDLKPRSLVYQVREGDEI